jgi:hypothetical protein
LPAAAGFATGEALLDDCWGTTVALPCAVGWAGDRALLDECVGTICGKAWAGGVARAGLGAVASSALLKALLAQRVCCETLGCSAWGWG